MNKSENCACEVKDQSICAIKSRLNLVVIISIILSTALASLFQFTPANSKLGSWSFLGTLIPAFYISIYVLYEHFKSVLTPYFLMLIRRALLVGIGMFAFPVVFISLFQNNLPLPLGMKTLLYISILGIPAVALFIFVLVITMIIVTYINNNAKNSVVTLNAETTTSEIN